MTASSKMVSLVVAILFLFVTPAVFAEADKKPGFHGWGDSQETTSKKEATKTLPEKAKEIPAPKNEAEKAVTAQPKAEKPRKAESKDKDRASQKIRQEREAFFKDTKNLRQEIYQKKLELRSELAKKKPSARRAKAIQKDIAKMQAKLDGKRLEHFLKLKKIDPDMRWRKYRGQGGYGGGCQNCPYQGRGDEGGYRMMGPGYGRYHMWEEEGNWKPQRGPADSGNLKKKSYSKPSAAVKDLSESDAIDIIRDFLKSTRDLNLKIGNLSDAGDAYKVDILTRSGSVFDRVLVDKQNGHLRPAE